MISQGEIATRLGMSRRTLTRWMSRLEIRPGRYQGVLGLYPEEVVEQIRLAHHAAMEARADLVRAALARRWAQKAPPAPPAAARRPSEGRIISVAEAKRRAKRGGAR